MKYRMKFDDAEAFQADLDAKDALIVTLKREREEAITAAVEAERARGRALYEALQFANQCAQPYSVKTQKQIDDALTGWDGCDSVTLTVGHLFGSRR